MFPPSFLIVQLFRRSKPRKTRTEEIRKAIQTQRKESISAIKYRLQSVYYEENIEIRKSQSQKAKKKGPFTFPWWFKIIAYILSFMFSTVSVFFIIIKGILFGDDKVTKWLTSFVISIFTSFLITQPIQVALVSMFFVFIFTKADEMTTPDPNDDGESFNKSEQTDEVNFL